MTFIPLPEYWPGEVILRLKPGVISRPGPQPLPPQLNELLALMRREYGLQRVETLLPTGIPIPMPPPDRTLGPAQPLPAGPSITPGSFTSFDPSRSPAGFDTGVPLEGVEEFSVPRTPEMEIEARSLLRLYLDPQRPAEAAVRRLATSAVTQYAEAIPVRWCLDQRASSQGPPSPNTKLAGPDATWGQWFTGRDKVGWMFTFTAAIYDMVRMRKLIAEPAT